MTTVLITGSNRGLGLEFVRQYAADGARVLATCRDPDAAHELAAVEGDVAIHPLDVTDHLAIAALADDLKEEAIDILIANAGVMSRGHRLGEMDYDEFEQVLRTNTVAPVAVTEAFLPHMERGEGKRVALITSLMGSIADNQGGAYYAYRSSKAGLNACGRSLAIDLAPRGFIVLLLHPGWVRTDMGGPSAPIGAETSVRGMRSVIADAKAEHSGRMFAYDGRELPW